MATRAIFDGSFADDVLHYSAFPSEPTVKPDGFFDVQLPIDNADKLNPMTLVALLTRMKGLPSAEKKLLVICHGSNEGLGIPLTQGSTNRATRDVLHILLVLGNATKRAQEISALPSTTQQAEWQKLLNGMKYVDGTQMFPTIDGDSAAACQRFFNYFLDRTTGQKSKFPEGDDVQVLTSPRSKFKIQFSRNGPTTSEIQPTATGSDVQSTEAQTWASARETSLSRARPVVPGPACSLAPKAARHSQTYLLAETARIIRAGLPKPCSRASKRCRV